MELIGIERHDLRPAAMTIIPPAERDAIVNHADQAGIGDGDTMGVAAEISQHLLRAAEGRLGIDDPPACRCRRPHAPSDRPNTTPAHR